MFDNVTTLLWFLVAICILVAIHEFGHFYVARRCGVKVIRFSIGFGPRLFSWRDKQGTEFALSAIPLGGYVKMLGERDDDVDPGERHLAHDNKSVPQRIAIAAAGPIANFILAIALYWVIFWQGTVAFAPVIGSVIEGSVAQKAGLETGQEIVSIDGKETSSQRDVMLSLMNRLGETGTIYFTLRYPDSDFIYESEGQLDKWLQGIEAPNPIEGIGIHFYVPPVSLKILSVEPDSAAAKAGIIAGDRIISADGEDLVDGEAWIAYVRERPGKVINLEVERESGRKMLTIQPSQRTLDSGEVVGFAGVTLPREAWPEGMKRTQYYNPMESLLEAGRKTWETAGFALLSVQKLLFGEISVKNLSGPIGIAKVAGDSGRDGVGSFVQFLAYMSILLGVLNLLPVPMLDGGHIMFYLVEWIKGSPVSEKVQLLGYQAGLAVILGVMVIAFYNDILRL